VNDNPEQHIVPGISISATGEATIAPAMADVLFDLALSLESPTGFPVDVEHVLAAILLAARHGEIDPQTEFTPDDPATVEILIKRVKSIFEDYDGAVGADD
jgi:hypothetical protein